MRKILVLILVSWLFACTSVEKADEGKANNPSPAGTNGESSVDYLPLEWNNSDHPERKAWTQYLLNLINSADVYQGFNKPSGDSKKFCANYDSLTKAQRVHMWASVVVAVAYYESGWKPSSWMNEALGTDSITHQTVRSEGLLQLSYDDIQAYPFCNKFSWAKDKSLSVSDPNKTIFSPTLNLDCGTRIMSSIALKRTGVIFVSNVYWSTLQSGGRYSKVNEIIARVKKAEQCQ